MANTPISNLPVATALSGSEQIPVVQAGTTSRTTTGAIATLANQSAGSVTSVNVVGGATGLTTTGGPITTSGVITMGGVLAPGSGGTGLTALGTGVQAALGAAVTGSGGIVLQTSASLITPDIGAATGASLVATGAVSAATIAATGAVTGATVTASGAVSGATVAATGAVTGATVTATGAISGLSVLTTNGIFFNNSTINANTTIVAGTNGLSVGPMTLASGVVVTVASGQRWVTL